MASAAVRNSRFALLNVAFGEDRALGSDDGVALFELEEIEQRGGFDGRQQRRRLSRLRSSARRCKSTRPPWSVRISSKPAIPPGRVCGSMMA